MAEPPIRGSPSKQLLAFDPQSSDPAVRRASTLPGMQAHGARVDPFANWTDQLQLSGAVRDDINVAPGSAVSAVLAQNAPVVLPPLHGQLQPLPTTWDATGRYYLPSVSSLGLQDPAIRAQEIIAQSQYPFGLDHTRDENQDWYPQARYSPSQEGRVLTYNPVQAAPGITKGEHPARQAAGEDLSSAMVRAPAGIQMTAPRAPGGAVRLIPRRGIIVEGVAQETEHTNVLALFPRSRYGTLEGVFIQQLHASGRFSVVFADLREAIDAFNQIPRAYPAWNIKYATIAEVVSAGLNGPFHSMASPEDGQLVICALIDTQPPVRDFDQRTDEYVANVTEALGDVRYCNRVSEENASVREYRVEYFNVQHAIHAYSCLNHLLLDTLRFDVSLPLSVLHTQARNAGSPRSPITPFQCSPNAKMEIDPTSPELSDTIEEQHVIDLLKVERGEDLRTTVMIRNIPNKFTADTFKTILDQWVFARYDFVYLRMDFMHHCNVGYAFVNFCEPRDILTLWANIQGKSWPDSISDKRAEVSYATQQGTEALVAKFRNSGIMLRPAEQRPRLFHVTGPRAGFEAPFPAPNDVNKLRRSVANTSHQGLYAPRNRSSTGASPRERERNGNLISPRATRQGAGASPRAFRHRPRQASTSQAAQNSPRMTSPRMVRQENRLLMNSPRGAGSPIKMEPRPYPSTDRR